MVHVTDYWPEVAEDLTKVSWSHATNSRAKPIMAHPPANSSDLSLEQFLQSVLASTQSGEKKGIKLDFKFLGVVEPSLIMLDNLRDKLNIPVWLNADILKGPGGGDPVE